MTRIGITTIILLLCFKGIARNDTTYVFLNPKGQKTGKDSATFYGIKYKSSDGFYNYKEYRAKGNQLHMEGSFMDSSSKIRLGTFKWYNENGSLDHTIEYVNGKAKTKEFYHANGKRSGLITYTPGGIEQKGWDENGNEVPGFIAEKEARFPGGPQEWKRYLERNLDANVAAASNAPPGIYTVKVQFIVDKEGKISNVQAVSVPADCPRCAREAERVIRKGPNWEPAVQNGRPVIYQAIQFISFQVSRI
jgi:hypothetical protein